MPCSVSRSEEEYYQRAINEKKYGISELDSRITERVACELAKLIESAGLESQISGVAKTWVKIHKEKDEDRCANERT